MVDESSAQQQQQQASPPAKGAWPAGEEEREEAWSGGEELEGLVSMEPGAAQQLLVQEAQELDKERSRQNRAAAAVSNQMYKDAQVL